RKRGVLIIGSGNMVHSFRYAMLNGPDFNTSFGHDWAWEANELFKQKITENRYDELANYSNLGEAVRKSIPTPEHYLPMLYSLAMREEDDALKFFNDDAVGGSFTMTSFQLG
ncbi:MAG: 4,5-DOPA dioxygenase extradiol, partial [Bacteroidota bacterium]|nr:4,5-DOPA dioxygenase extradiol [Bacteroidota bacterium]MDX5430949.1 4,5-DOPA dioxygenase extradiol [Bacteroidota bacterium]MDX5469697.1 4,5-DOPA dioxygenase extradiol [Bacteroidota bacterium]